MKMNFKDILTNNEIITKDDILTINYITATGKGCFKLLMPAKFPATAATMKIIIDMFLKAEAPEHITEDLITKLDKLNFKELNNAFIEVLEGAENVVINDDIYIIYNDEATAPAEVTEEAPRPEAVEVATVEKPEAAENKTTAPATAEETENKPRPRAEVTTAPPHPQNKPPYYIAVIPEAMNHTTTGDSKPASLKRANIPPRQNKRRITSYNRRQQPNKGILYHYNAIQWHYSPAGLYSSIKGYTRAYNAQTAPPGLYATGDSLKAGIIRAQTMPNLSYHDTC